ncbi:type II toxin-antitoxin system RelE/ParE family toxin (plasmid) [Fructilactobacillus vespulae]|uniref:type II toxin-antitoxin system RelE/ParE family toxin n=1 Tax=Fructilactobacillus vespulae TaxID=1249630 RepID=UPI0039B51D1D
MKKISFDYADFKEFKKFLDSLSAKSADKLTELIKKVENHGMQEAQERQWVKKLEKNLYEIRARFGSNSNRAIYFKFKDSKFIITHGFKKKTNKTPKKEINKGIRIRNSYLKNNEHFKR